MIANRLTKALSKSKFNKFLGQVNLVNIVDKIAERQAAELQKKELDHNTIQAYIGDDDESI